MFWNKELMPERPICSQNWWFLIYATKILALVHVILSLFLE